AVPWRELEGTEAEVEVVSLQAELKECVAWFGPLRTARRRAAVLPPGATLCAEAPAGGPGGRGPAGGPYRPPPAGGPGRPGHRPGGAVAGAATRCGDCLSDKSGIHADALRAGARRRGGAAVPPRPAARPAAGAPRRPRRGPPPRLSGRAGGTGPQA